VRNLLRIGLGLLLANNIATFAQQYVISTIAGRGAPLFQPSALSAAIDPNGAAVDTAGNVYFSSRHAVYRLDSSGALARLAGGYAAGCAGDGGPAINAQLNTPTAVAVDAAGAIYIADAQNKRIRKVSPDGVITSFAGSNNPDCAASGVPEVYAKLQSLAGVAVDAAGAVYIGDRSNRSVIKVSGGVVTTLIDNVGVSGVAVDTAGNVYIAGSGITKVAPNGVVSIVLVSNWGATSVAVDPAGNVYFASESNGNGTISKVTPQGEVSALVDVGWNYARGIAIDAAANLYIADSSDFRIQKLSPDGVLSTAAGNGTDTNLGDGGPAADTQLWALGVALDAAGDLYVADSGHSRVRKISPDGTIMTVAGGGVSPYIAPTGDGGQATDATVFPSAVAVDSLGNLYIADWLDIRKVGLDGVISTLQNIPATNLAFGPDGSLYASATSVNEILPTGAVVPVAGNGFIYPLCVHWDFAPPCPPPPTPPPLGDGGPATQATIFPEGMAVDSANNLYIADTQGRIRKVFNSTGAIVTIAAGALKTPMAVAFDAAGNLYIADAGNSRVQKVSTDGTVTTIAGNGSPGHSGDGGLAVDAQLGGPRGLAIDADGNIYIADTDSIRLLKPVTADAPVAATSTIHQGPPASINPSRNGTPQR
jgi:sugar lactone lactonase YvrE